MSFFARLMGSDPDSRIKKARKFLDRRDFGEARFELLELDHPDATALMKQALEGLILLNLSEAEARPDSQPHKPSNNQHMQKPDARPYAKADGDVQ